MEQIISLIDFIWDASFMGRVVTPKSLSPHNKKIPEPGGPSVWSLHVLPVSVCFLRVNIYIYTFSNIPTILIHLLLMTTVMMCTKEEYKYGGALPTSV